MLQRLKFAKGINSGEKGLKEKKMNVNFISLLHQSVRWFLVKKKFGKFQPNSLGTTLSKTRRSIPHTTYQTACHRVLQLFLKVGEKMLLIFIQKIMNQVTGIKNT